MKIWVIGRSYPEQKNGMKGSFELEQAKLLAQKGHNVTYLSVVFHPFKKVKKWGYVSWEESGIRACTYSQFYAPERMKLRWKWLLELRWKELLHHAEEISGIPDIIHVHYPGMITEPDAIFEYRNKGAKIVVTDHWSKTLMNDLDNHQRKQLIRYANEADGFICVGMPLKRAVQKITNTDRDIFVIPNVVSNLFVPDLKNGHNRKFHFITVGRLVPGKQYDGILQAFASKFKGNGNACLTVVGGGKLMSELQKMSSELGISEQVEFTGIMPREEVAKRTAAADCLVCFSRLETFGVPVIEAWACGIPAIGTDGLGFLEYYNESLGYIVSHDSVEELAEAMEKIVGNRDRYSKEEISSFARKNFGEDAVYEKLMKVYRGIRSVGSNDENSKCNRTNI